MSLTIKNKNLNLHKSFSTKSLSGEYTCIGSYEDKTTNCIYYFLYSEDNIGVAGKYDCIVEYSQVENKTTVVYQDGKTGSNGINENILNFDKDHLITGINKVEDILYFTDNLNRPRKIDVEKAKRNEQYIKLGPTFQGILDNPTLGSELIINNTWDIRSVDGDNTINGATSNVTSSDTGSFRFITEASGSSDIHIRKLGIVSPGKYYELSYEIDSSNKDNGLATYTADDDAEQININTTVGTHKTKYFSKNTFFLIKRSSHGADITISNISLKEIKEESTILVGVTNNHPFEKNDHLYLQQFGIISPDLLGKGYNGYAKAVGIIKRFAKGTTHVTLTQNSKTVTMQGATPTDGLLSGDFVCVVVSGNAYFIEIDFIVDTHTFEATNAWTNIGIATTSFNLSTFNPDLNTDNGIITSTPFIDEVETSPGGKVLHAQPDDAYSPLISFGEFEDKMLYLDALSHQPRYKPEFSFNKEPARVNHIVGKFFQFRYRYVYKDGTVSAYSGISDVANQSVYTKRYISGEDNTTINNAVNNIINIKYNDSISYVDKVEVVARDGNDGEFFLVETIPNDFIKYLKRKKNESLFSTPSLFFGGSTQTNVEFSTAIFRNDGVYPFVSKTDIDKLQDALPKLAKAQTILPKNRIAYGNVVDGYDNTDIYCNLKIKPVTSLQASDQPINNMLLVGDTYSNAPDFEVVNAGGPNISTVFKVSFDLSGLDPETNGGEGVIDLNYNWVKTLFQNHEVTLGQNSVGTGVALVPRGGHFRHTSSISNPGSVDAIGLHIEEKINLLEFDLEDSVGYFTQGSSVSSLQTRPQKNLTTASYNTSNNKLSITFTYQEDYHPFENENIGVVNIFSNDVNYSLTGNSGINSVDFSGKGKSSGGATNMHHQEVNSLKSSFRGAPSFGKSYKTGANHGFGLVYYDETNRASFVNTSKAINSFNSGTNVYAPFYTEINQPQSTFNGLEWRIYHKPPIWATHYQWVYSGNNTLDEFIQIPILNSYKGTGNNSNKIYLGLGSLKGLCEEDIDLESYIDSTSAVIDYVYAKGDRVRYISFGLTGISGDDSNENSRKYFKENIDVPISSYDFYTQEEIQDAVGGSDRIPGFYIVIDSPTDAGNDIDFSEANDGDIDGSIAVDHADVDHTDDDFSHNGYHRLIVEIYRPKKSIQSEVSGLFYEVGEKLDIENPGTDFRSHQGQGSDYFFDEESGMEVTAIDGLNGSIDDSGNQTTNFASGTLIHGDVYTRRRVMVPFHNNNGSSGIAPVAFACESYYLTDFYNSDNWDKGRVNIVNPYSEERRLPASVYYSDVFTSTANFNGLSTFDMATSPYYDYNQDFGSIQLLTLKGDNLLIFHENKVARALVGKNIINYADGASNVTLSQDILSDYAQVYSAENGCSLNPESIVENNDRFYFVDIKRGSILRLGGDGITRISDYGLSDYIRDKGQVYIDQEVENLKIVAGYDPKYDEYIVTFPSTLKTEDYNNSGFWGFDSSNVDESFTLIGNQDPGVFDPAKTIAFNDTLKKWTSFYSYKPEFYGKINRQFVTYKNGKIYRHNTENKSNFNTFYGVRYNSNIEFPFNSDPSSVKTYNSISLESDTKLLTNMSTNMGQYNNSYDSVISTQIGYKKVDGTISTQVSSPYCLYGSPSSNFYKDLSPGDLIRFYNAENSSPQYNVVKSILTKQKVDLDNPVIYRSKNNRIDVIDYKTKEGIQYSKIPFAPSKFNVNEYGEFQGDFNGDASNIFGLGMFSADRYASNFALKGDFKSNSLPFMGSKSTTVSNIIPGGVYGILDIREDFKFEEVFDLDGSLNKGKDIISSKGNFSNSSDWTVIDSGVKVQKNKKRSGNVLYFDKQNSSSQIRTTSTVDFKSNSKYVISFRLDLIDLLDRSKVFLSFRIGDRVDQSGKLGSSFQTISIDSTNYLQNHEIELNSGDENIDPYLYIRSEENQPEFHINNLKVQKVNPPRGIFVAKNGTSSRSRSSVFPCEYSLHCMDVKTGETTHAGWVYNVTQERVEFISDNYSSLQGNKFYFIVKEGLIDGEKLKGHYLKTILTSHWYQSKYKFNLYAANVDVDKSELSNK